MHRPDSGRRAKKSEPKSGSRAWHSAKATVFHDNTAIHLYRRSTQLAAAAAIFCDVDAHVVRVARRTLAV
jgi:hypothetical protein